MRRLLAFLAGAFLTVGAAGDQAPDPVELLPDGAATVRNTGDARAFSQPSANLPFERQFDFRLGDGVFRKLWVSAPSSTASSDGLGPLYNARGCQSCHVRDGRGRPPESGEAASSLLMRLSVPPTAPRWSPFWGACDASSSRSSRGYDDRGRWRLRFHLRRLDAQPALGQSSRAAVRGGRSTSDG